MKYFLLFMCISVQLCLAQNTDSIAGSTELNELKLRLESLEKKLEKSDSVQKRELGILSRTSLGMFVLLRAGELDWNQNAFNVEKGEPEKLHPRFWSRPLFYLILDSKLSKQFDFRFSLQNYPFSIFGGNSDSRLSLLLAELWLDYKINDKYSLKFGRQYASNIWENQIGTQFDFWPHDGLSFKSSHNIDNLELSTKAAFFIENYVNNASFKDQGKLYGVSTKLENKESKTPWHLALGFLQAESLPNTYYSSLGQFFYDGDLAPEYSVLLSQIGLRFKNLSNLSFLVDVYHNFKKYKHNPQSNLIRDLNGKNSFDDGFDSSSTPDFTNQRTGFFGSVSKDFPFISKDLNISLGYLYMEKYAALDFFAQYDLARWASTNVKGVDFTIKYKLNKNITFRNRTFFMEEIKGFNAIDPNFVRQGNRTRFDIIINF